MNVSPGFALAALLAGPALQAQSPARPVLGQRVVLVTGSTSGLGREVALRLAAGGAFVIVHGRDSARGAEVVREIAQAGNGSARFYAADFASNGEVRRFAEERDWDQFHSPKNLSMALSVEASELLEHFQWLTEAQSLNVSLEKREAAAEEIADVLLYLIRIADKLNINLVDAANKKLALNEQKYPPDKSRGNSRKYTEI